MNWAIVAGIAGLAALVATRILARRWIFTRWTRGHITDRQAKVLLFAVSFGPIFAIGLWLAAIAPFPDNLIILAAFTLGLAPAVGLGAAVFDYTSKHVLKRDAGRHD